MTTGTKKVLYAEDEFTNRKLLEIKLSSIGVECDVVQDGIKALEMYSSKQYDLIILDQYMPGMNGDEVARKIREDNPEIPMIAITSDDGNIPSLHQAGFNEVFIKPLFGHNYIDLIKNYL